MTPHVRLAFSKHWRFDCLFRILSRLASKKASKHCIITLCERNPLVTNEILFHYVVMEGVDIGAWHPSPSYQLLHRVQIIVERVPLSLQRTRLSPTRHFHFRMNTKGYWKNSDNWIIRCHKFPSDVLISSKVYSFYVIKNSPRDM